MPQYGNKRLLATLSWHVRQQGQPAAAAAAAAQAKAQKTFGKLYGITEESFLEFLDNEDPNVFVIIHLHLNVLWSSLVLQTIVLLTIHTCSIFDRANAWMNALQK